MVNIDALENRQNVKMMAMFLIVQFFGLFLAAQVYSGVPLVEASSMQLSVSVGTAVVYITLIVVFSIILLMVVRRYRGGRMLALLEAYQIVIAAFIVALILLSSLSGNIGLLFGGAAPDSTSIYAVAGIAAIALAAAKNRWPNMLRNTAAIVISVGIGVAIGMVFSFYVALFFMFLLAIYDFVAVFITKHMVVLGEAMASQNLSFLIGAGGAEAIDQRELSKEELDMYRKGVRYSHGSEWLREALEARKLVPVFARRELGDGDLAMPLMLEVSAYATFGNFTASIIIALGAALGLALTFAILKRYRRALPAIPPILLGIIIVFGAYAALTGGAV